MIANLRAEWPSTLVVIAAFIIASLALMVLCAWETLAQDQQTLLEPPPFFHHPQFAAGQADPYKGNCRRPDGADCCASVHCAPVPSDDLGRLQLKPNGPFVDPYSLMPRPSICDSAALPPLYNALDHACTGQITGSISCIFLRGGSV